MTRDDLRKISLRVLEEREEGEKAAHYILRATSGTTLQPPVVFAQRLGARSPVLFPVLAKHGLRRTLLMQGPRLSTLLQVMRVYLEADITGAELLPLEMGDITPETGGLLSAFVPEAVFGSPSFLLKARTLFGDDAGSSLDSVRFFQIQGEMLTPALQHTLKTALPHAELEETYGMSELNSLGVKCPYLPLNRFHVSRQGITLRVENEDDEGVGEILVTGPLGKKTTLVDYKTGDAGKVYEQPCPCGEEMSFHVIGRIGFDFIRIAGGVLRREECDRIAEDLAVYLADVRFVLQRDMSEGRVRGKMTLEIVPTALLLMREDKESFIAQEIGRRFQVTPSRFLQHLIESGDFLPLHVRFVDVLLNRGHKSVRLREIYD